MKKSSMLRRVSALLIAMMIMLYTPLFTLAEVTESVPESTVTTQAPIETEVPVQSQEPTQDPVVSEDPTQEPVVDPTEDPTQEPVVDPTEDPTQEPVVDPTEDPTQEPVVDPTEDPTQEPVVDPIEDPTEEPVAPIAPMVMAAAPALWDDHTVSVTVGVTIGNGNEKNYYVDLTCTAGGWWHNGKHTISISALVDALGKKTDLQGYSFIDRRENPGDSWITMGSGNWTINRDAHVHVKCGEKQYTVTYYDEKNDRLSGPTNVAVGGTITLAPVVEDRIGYTYDWVSTPAGCQPGGTMPGDDVSFRLEWTQLKYTVTYTDNLGGKAFADQVHDNLVYDQKTPSFDGTPSYAGYTFDGWNVDSIPEKVSGTVTYTAQWTRTVYTVTYTDGSTATSDTPTFGDGIVTPLYHGDLVLKNKIADPAGTAKYKFAGWAYAENRVVTKASDVLVKEDDKIDGANVTLKATWALITYTVTYTDGVDNEEVFKDLKTTNLTYGENTPKFGANPTRPGFTFKGWDKAIAATVTADATYTAQWTQEYYTIIYTDGVDNTELFKDQKTENVVYGETTPAFSGTPKRSGYKFNGWNPTVSAKVVGNATYAAKWTKIDSGKGSSSDVPKTGDFDTINQTMLLQITLALFMLSMASFALYQKKAKKVQ